MTREEIEERMGWEPHRKVDAVTVGTNSLLDRIERVVIAAEKAERERCAQLCESYGMPDGTSETALALAAAIRGMK